MNAMKLHCFRGFWWRRLWQELFWVHSPNCDWKVIGWWMWWVKWSITICCTGLYTAVLIIRNTGGGGKILKNWVKIISTKEGWPQRMKLSGSVCCVQCRYSKGDQHYNDGIRIWLKVTLYTSSGKFLPVIRCVTVYVVIFADITLS